MLQNLAFSCMLPYVLTFHKLKNTFSPFLHKFLRVFHVVTRAEMKNRKFTKQNNEVYFPEAINQQRCKSFFNVSLNIESTIAFIRAVPPSHISNLGGDFFLYKVLSAWQND